MAFIQIPGLTEVIEIHVPRPCLEQIREMAAIMNVDIDEFILLGLSHIAGIAYYDPNHPLHDYFENLRKKNELWKLKMENRNRG